NRLLVVYDPRFAPVEAVVRGGARNRARDGADGVRDFAGERRSAGDDRRTAAGARHGVGGALRIAAGAGRARARLARRHAGARRRSRGRDAGSEDRADARARRRAPRGNRQPPAAAGHAQIAGLRLFVAVLLPDDIRQRLAAAIDRLRPHAADVAWVAESNLHVTLKFLGQVDETRAPALADALRATLA